MKLYVSLSAGLLLCGLSQSAHAEVLWKDGFEGGTLENWTLLNGTKGARQNISVVNEPVFEGSRACKIDLHPDDLWSNGHNRVELHYDAKRTREGETTYFAWHFRLAAEAAQLNDIAYWESDNTYLQSMAFFVRPLDGKTTLSFRTNEPYKEQWSGPIEVGVYHRVVMRILWSKDDEIGRVSVWLGDKNIVNDVAAQTKPDENPMFIQLGLHRDATGPATETIYIDNAIEGTTLQDVSDLPETGTGGGGGQPGTAGNAGTGVAGASAGDDSGSKDDDSCGCRAAGAGQLNSGLIAAAVAGCALLFVRLRTRRTRGGAPPLR